VIGYDKGSNKGESGYCRSDVMMLVCLQEKEKRQSFCRYGDTKLSSGHGTRNNARHSFGGPAAPSIGQGLTGSTSPLHRDNSTVSKDR